MSKPETLERATRVLFCLPRPSIIAVPGFYLGPLPVSNCKVWLRALRFDPASAVVGLAVVGRYIRYGASFLSISSKSSFDERV